jgi:hypothetical protein
MMILDIYHNKDGVITCITIKNLGHDYEAEQWVLVTYYEPKVTETITEWILRDETGVRCVWKPSDNKNDKPVITQRSSEFTGTWAKGPNEVSF